MTEAVEEYPAHQGEVGNLRMILTLLKNLLDTQPFILRHVEHLDVFRFDDYRRVQADLKTYTSSFP